MATECPRQFVCTPLLKGRLSHSFSLRHQLMTSSLTEIENRLWDAADELRANSKLKSSEYSVPVLGPYLPPLRRSSVHGCRGRVG